MRNNASSSFQRRAGRRAALIVGALAAALVSVAGAGAAVPARAVPAFSHVVVVVFENKEVGDVVGSPQAPTFTRLARSYATLTDYMAVTHPSLPNYLALVSGSTQGITDDCTDCLVGGRSLADTLEAAGRSWKTYAEDLPSAGFTGGSAGDYAKKHDPLLYFRSVLARPADRSRVVPLTQLPRDLARGALPDFSLVVPNKCHDMHDCSVATGDAWLHGFLPPLLRSHVMRNGVVFIVFDEGSSDQGGGGHVAALVVGPTVRPGSRFTAPTGHYGLLRTIEDAFGLPYLGGSASASPITGIWGLKTAASAPMRAPAAAGAGRSAAGAPHGRPAPPAPLPYLSSAASASPIAGLWWSQPAPAATAASAPTCTSPGSGVGRGPAVRPRGEATPPSQEGDDD
jgi:acid phosphatase